MLFGSEGTVVLLRIESMGRHSLLVKSDTLTAFIYAANSLAQDAIEVTANIRFHFAEVNEATFCDKTDDTALFRHLRGCWEVVGRLGGGEQEDTFSTKTGLVDCD
jgi:hypothetical protein